MPFCARHSSFGQSSLLLSFFSILYSWLFLDSRNMCPSMIFRKGQSLNLLLYQKCYSLFCPEGRWQFWVKPNLSSCLLPKAQLPILWFHVLRPCTEYFDLRGFKDRTPVAFSTCVIASQKACAWHILLDVVVLLGNCLACFSAHWWFNQCFHPYFIMGYIFLCLILCLLYPYLWTVLRGTFLSRKVGYTNFTFYSQRNWRNMEWQLWCGFVMLPMIRHLLKKKEFKF